MSRVIRIPEELYIALGERAKPFQTPAEVIWCLLEETNSVNNLKNKSSQFSVASKSKRHKPTVEEWKEHIEIVLGYREGETNIGTPSWTTNIYDKLCNGEIAFGLKGANFTEAMLTVIYDRNQKKYKTALKGLRATIADGQAKGDSFKTLINVYGRIFRHGLD